MVNNLRVTACTDCNGHNAGRESGGQANDESSVRLRQISAVSKHLPFRGVQSLRIDRSTLFSAVLNSKVSLLMKICNNLVLTLSCLLATSFGTGSADAGNKPGGKGLAGKGPGAGLEQRRKMMMSKFDKDGDGKLSEAERQAAKAAFGKQGPGGQGQPNPEMMQKAIAKFDKDGDGKLNEAERQAAKASFGKQGPGGQGQPNPEMMQKILARFDKDGDGKLSESERQAARAAKGTFGGATGKPGQKKPKNP